MRLSRVFLGLALLASVTACKSDSPFLRSGLTITTDAQSYTFSTPGPEVRIIVENTTSNVIALAAGCDGNVKPRLERLVDGLVIVDDNAGCITTLPSEPILLEPGTTIEVIAVPKERGTYRARVLVDVKDQQVKYSHETTATFVVL